MKTHVRSYDVAYARHVSAVHVGERTCKACERSVCYNMVKKYIQENANKDDIAPPTQRTRGNKKHQVDMSG